MELDDPGSVGGWPARKRLEIKMCVIKSFSDYLIWAFDREHNANRQVKLYAAYTDHSTRVFRMEDMTQLQDWLSRRAERPIELPRFNVTEMRGPYWMDYTREARALVTRLFRDELELYGYQF
jgi:hypothetical protein